MEQNQNLEIAGAKIVFRNFAGQGSTYNREGSRNFSVVIPTKEAAIALFNDGWNVAVKAQTQEDKDAIRKCDGFIEKVKYLESVGSDNDALYHLKCNVNLDSKKPAEVYLVAGKKKRPILLTKDTIAQVDVLDIAFCDIVISPYHWCSPRGEGITAYLKTMYVNINSDPFAEKYAYEEEDEEI